jgi:dTDP-4-amino-4,6-dideoxygalactose transaminase
MDAIMGLAGAHDLKVIEDCAQAHGARWRGRPVGSIGHAAAFSFCNDKIMSTCGEGGLVATNDEDVWRRAWEYKDHGKGIEALHAAEAAGGAAFKWLHEHFGTNWRMTEVQAAVGRVHLRKLDGWVAQRRSNAAALERVLSDVPSLRLACPSDDAFHAYYRYYVFIRRGFLLPGWSRDRVIDELMAADVPCGSGTCPEIYREQAFIGAGLGRADRLPVAREVGETSIALLTDPTMLAEDAERMAGALASIMGQAAKGGALS